MDQRLKALLDQALDADDIRHADAAAACDRQRPQVTLMCAPDHDKAPTGADLILLARRSPTFRAAVLELIRGEE